jgi:hypothetical protein
MTRHRVASQWIGGQRTVYREAGTAPHDMAAREDGLPLGGWSKTGLTRWVALLACHRSGGHG